MKSLVSPKSFFRSFGGSWKEKGTTSPQLEVHSEEAAVAPPTSQTGLLAKRIRAKISPPSTPNLSPAAGGQTGAGAGAGAFPQQSEQNARQHVPVQKSQSLPQMPVAYPPEAQQRNRKQMIVWPVELVRQKLPSWSPPNVQRELEASAGIPVADEEDGWLGIEFQPRVDGHLVITRIVEGGPADGTKSVMVGDIIVGIRGFFARALTPQQIKELTKGTAGSKLALTLGSEFERGHSYTMEHKLLGGGKVNVARVKVVNMKPTKPVCMEPESGLNILYTSSGLADDAMSVVGADDGEQQDLQEFISSEDQEQKEISEAMTTAVSLNDDCTEDGGSSNGNTPRKSSDSPKLQSEAPHPTPVKGLQEASHPTPVKGEIESEAPHPTPVKGGAADVEHEA